MAAHKVTDQQILREWPDCPSVTELAARYGMNPRNMAARVKRLREAGAELISTDRRSPAYREVRTNYDARLEVTMESGVVIVGSDAHFWPEDKTTAFKAFVHFIKELKPQIVILNGDMFDGASISRWPRIGWDKRPTVLDELKVCQERLTEVEDAAGNARRYWPLGNHDGRWERRLAMAAPEYEGVKNFALKDHFPAWVPCWAVKLNQNTLIKHKWKGGKYAVANNTLNAGVSMVTGHLHSLKWWPHTDESVIGTRYGVDTGCLADPGGRQFIDYTEDGVKDWRAGFAVLTYHKGQLLQPELVKVHGEGEVDFRGQILRI